MAVQHKRRTRAREDWAIDRLRQENLNALVDYGEKILVKRMWRFEDFEAGDVEKCSYCQTANGSDDLDQELAEMYGQSGSSYCTECYGTNYEGGFQDGFDLVWAIFTDDDEDDKVDKSGNIIKITPRVQLPYAPYVQQGDLIVRVDRWSKNLSRILREEGRYQLGVVEPTLLRPQAGTPVDYEDLLVGQEAEARRLPEEHPFQVLVFEGDPDTTIGGVRPVQHDRRSPVREGWAVDRLRQENLDALVDFGEKVIIRRVWRFEDYQSGMTTKCADCQTTSEGGRDLDYDLADMYGQSGETHCESCFGTNYTDGFMPIIFYTWAIFTDDAEDDSITKSGNLIRDTPTVDLPYAPYVQQGDLIIRLRSWNDDYTEPGDELRRYVLGAVTPTFIRPHQNDARDTDDLLVGQRAQARNVPVEHPFYEVETEPEGLVGFEISDIQKAILWGSFESILRHAWAEDEDLLEITIEGEATEPNEVERELPPLIIWNKVVHDNTLHIVTVDE